jgi:hypothetical protein
MALDEWVRLIAAAIVGLSAATTAIVAIIGLNKWRAELRGKTDFELARRILKNAYRVRDGFRVVRSPLMYGSEYADRPDRKEEERNCRRLDTDYAYNRRLKAVQDPYYELELDLLEAEALWGNDLVEAKKALRNCVVELIHNIGMYLDSQFEQGSVPLESVKDTRKVVYFSDPENDPFADKVSAAVGEFESLLKSKVRR